MQVTYVLLLGYENDGRIKGRHISYKLLRTGAIPGYYPLPLGKKQFHIHFKISLIYHYVQYSVNIVARSQRVKRKRKAVNLEGVPQAGVLCYRW